MADEITTVLEQVATLFKTLETTEDLGDRVWVHPKEVASIDTSTLPFAIVSKMNAEVGSWGTFSFGEGIHDWNVLIAIYLANGPVRVTSTDQFTQTAIANASEWYKKISDLLFQNMTLGGSVVNIGDDEGTLFTYVTDNILWDGQQYWGHLILLPVKQIILQDVST